VREEYIDQIFDDAGYTWQPGGFFESDLFYQIYISAFGNEPMVGWDSTATASEDSVNVAYGEDLYFTTRSWTSDF
jgi:hypothetical protein